MEDLLKLDYFNLVHEKLERKFAKIFLPIKNSLILFVCLFVCLFLGGGSGEGIFCLHLSIASLVDFLSASPVWEAFQITGYF